MTTGMLHGVNTHDCGSKMCRVPGGEADGGAGRLQALLYIGWSAWPLVKFIRAET